MSEQPLTPAGSSGEPTELPRTCLRCLAKGETARHLGDTRRTRAWGCTACAYIWTEPIE